MPGVDWTDDVAAYYESPRVRSRIAEYCGGRGHDPDTLTCWRIAGYGGRRRLVEADGAPVACDNEEMPTLLEEGADVCRSLADRRGTLLQLDVDYVNPQDPGEPYLEPHRVFGRLEPVHRVLREIFAAYGLEPRVLLTGRGYHFTLLARFGTAFHAGLVGIAAPSASLAARYERQIREVPAATLMGFGHDGAGRLLEHLVHCALHRLRDRTAVPVTLADVPPPGGGPFICLDLSAYADPVLQRHARCAFSTNQKSGVQGAAAERPFVVAVPREDEPLVTLLRRREEPELAAAAAAMADTRIPEVTDDALAWIEDYRHGPVGRFHQEFDLGPQAEPSAWPFTYDSVEPREWPACIAVPLEYPNPSLLRPVYLRTVALGLWSMGWHPRSIAGLIRSKYERDYGWGDLFYRYDAAARAEFYVRLFCGAVVDGLDGGSAFTCATQEGRGLCEPGRCRDDQRRDFEWLGEHLDERAKAAR